MNSSHLTDDQLQSYLDRNPTAGGIEDHLKSCARCRQALAAYRSLYSAMAEDPGVRLAPDFAEAVMARLPRREAVAEHESIRRLNIRDSIAAFAAFMVFLAAAIYFLKPTLLAGSLAGWFGLSNLSGNQFFNDVSGYITRLNINTALILFVLLALVGIGFIDHIITRHRRQQKPISYLISI